MFGRLPGVLTSAMHFESAAGATVEYTAMLLGATGNVGGRILHLLVQSPLCKKVVVVTRRHVADSLENERQGCIRLLERHATELEQLRTPGASESAKS